MYKNSTLADQFGVKPTSIPSPAVQPKRVFFPSTPKGSALRLPEARPAVANNRMLFIAYPARPRRVPNQGLENFHGAKVPPAALGWMSVSAPNTNCPVCQLYPSWPPPAMPAGLKLLLVTLPHS